MGKYLDKTGLQYFYNKLKDKFADKSALDSLTGAMQWKGQLSTLPTDLSTYSAGNVISVDNKEYVCTEVDGTKSWIELGDEGSYLLKTAAESTYLKKAAGEVKTDNLADDSVTKAKLDDSVQTSLGKADNSLQIGETNTQSNQTVITTESTENYNNGLKVQNSSNGTEITPTGITFGLNTQPIGIYRKGTYELKLNSATGSSLTLSGVAAPVNNTDAVNKKYVDDKVSGFVKLGETNGASTSATTFKTNTTGQALNIQASDSTTYLNGISVSVGTRSSETAAALTKTALVFGKQGTNYGRVEVNSNNKLQITGLDTPTSDTDAANKKYVDTSVLSKVDKDNITTSLKAVVIDTTNADSGEQNLANLHAYEENLKKLGVDISSDSPIIPVVDQVGYTGFVQYFSVDGKYVGLINYTEGTDAFIISIDYQGVCSIEELLFTSSHSFTSLEDDVFELQTSVTNLGDDVKLKPDKSTLATSLQAITIYTDNTTEHKAANLANIKAYEANLQALGVDVTKSPMIPIVIYQGDCGYIQRYPETDLFTGLYRIDDSTTFAIVVMSTGQYNEYALATEDYVENNLHNHNYTSLSTTSKTVIGAINEVNAAKITGVKINGETKTPTSGVIDLGTISGGSGTTDTAMSDTSTNPVQNKVIKAYIDGLVGNAITQLSEI